MTVNEQIVDSVASANLKPPGDGPSFYSNPAMGDAVAHQQHRKGFLMSEQTISNEELARKAAEASQSRQKLHVAKVEMMKHISRFIGEAENLRALTDIIANRQGVETKELWVWTKEQLFP